MILLYSLKGACSQDGRRLHTSGVMCVIIGARRRDRLQKYKKKYSKKLNEWVLQVIFSFSPNTTPCFCRISGEADVTVWMQGQGVTRRR